MTTSFTRYWSDVRAHIAERTATSPCLESLIVKRRRFNQNHSGHSYCVENGVLAPRNYTQYQAPQTEGNIKTLLRAPHHDIEWQEAS